MRVTAVDLADRPFPSVGRLGNRDKLDMMAHETVRPDLDLVNATPFSHQFQLALVIFVANERLLPVVSPLSDVLGQTKCDKTCHSSHDQS